MVAARCHQQSLRELAGALEDLDAVASRVAGEPAAPPEDVSLVLPWRAGVTKATQYVVEVVDDQTEVRLRVHLTVALGDVYLAAVVNVEPCTRLGDALLRLVDLLQAQHIGIERHNRRGPAGRDDDVHVVDPHPAEPTPPAPPPRSRVK